MSKTSRVNLKGYFKTGAAPTQGQFGNLIDSSFNKVDDKLTVLPVGDSRHLGIGTADPQSPLSIKANETSQALIGFEVDEDNKTWNIKHLNSNGHGTGLNIGQQTDGDGQFYLQPGGHVGIGTINPLANLQVSDAEGPWLRLENTEGHTTAIEQTADNLIISTSSAAGKIIFGIGHQSELRPSANINALMVLNQDGNVGIGHSSPDAKLQVDGGNILIGNIAPPLPHAILSPIGIQAKIGDEPHHFVVNPDGGKLGVGVDDPQAKIHAYDPTDAVLKLVGDQNPTITFSIEGEDSAQLRYKEEKILSVFDTRLHIESMDDNGLTVIAENAPTLNFLRPSSDPDIEDGTGFIQLSPTALVIQSGSIEEPGLISLKGKVAFGTEQPEAELHIASTITDTLLMLEGPIGPAIKFKNGDGLTAQMAFERGEAMSITGGETGMLEAIDLHGNVNVKSSQTQASFKIVSQEKQDPTPSSEEQESTDPNSGQAPEGEEESNEEGASEEESNEEQSNDEEVTFNENPEYTIYFEAQANPYLQLQGLGEKSAVIEFLDGANLKFHNGAGENLDLLTLQGHTDVVGNLNVSGDTEFQTKLTVSNDTWLKGALNVDGAVVLAGKTAIGDELIVTGKAGLSDDLQLTGSAQFDSDLSVAGSTGLTGDLSVTGNTILKKELQVTKKVLFKDALTVDGDVGLVAKTTIGDELIVTGKTSLNDGLLLTGSAQFDSDLSVAGSVSLTGDLSATGNTVLKKELQVAKKALFKDTLDVEGVASFTNKVNLGDELAVTGKSILSADLDVTGTSTLNGNVDITGTTSLVGDFTAKGATVLDGSMSCKGNAEIKQDLNVDKNTLLKGTLTVDEISSFSKKVTMSNDLEATGTALFKGSSANSVALHTTGKTKLDNDLEISGKTTVTGNLALTGDTTLEGETTMTGDATIDGDLTVSGALKTSGGVSSQGGKVKRDFFVQNLESVGSLIQLKTNIKKGEDWKYRILIEGYNHTASTAINTDVVGLAAAPEALNTKENNYDNGIGITQKYGSDDFLVLEIAPNMAGKTAAAIGFSVSAWLFNAENEITVEMI